MSVEWLIDNVSCSLAVADASLCDVVFNDGTVSKQHFRMFCERGAEGKEIALLQDTR